MGNPGEGFFSELAASQFFFFFLVVHLSIAYDLYINFCDYQYYVFYK